MAKTSITVVTKYPTYLFSLMVVIDYLIGLRSKFYIAYNT